MPKLVAGVTQIDRSPLFYTSNGYKFQTATQANNHQRETPEARQAPRALAIGAFYITLYSPTTHPF